ncbi:phosphatidylinositol kinase [Schizosaccharomyces cryophilus OY26]|uniref:1-phosphatidylinositol 4-kinase n=1 Tax=Schizosaccharomyces cryophilus (strain OY26 / ATCC MYA-4695 / CBS 11777 / NBRC 106824 / NRRL Y48691) TaxID=653667 RepID=S9WXP9_SCHCR|nr:phosphatidylinositol kinase [Schizosaccharomyces cryophilus OY26]EPY49472.1 phosphatidylinositol kinase [Schizosaccharomyces cryophilus OY26]
MECIDRNIRRESLRKLGSLPTHGWSFFEKICHQNSELLKRNDFLFHLERIEDTVLSICAVSLESRDLEEARILYGQLQFYLKKYVFLEGNENLETTLSSLDDSSFCKIFPVSSKCVPSILNGMLSLAKQHEEIAACVISLLDSIIKTFESLIIEGTTDSTSYILRRIFYASHLSFILNEIAKNCEEMQIESICLWILEVCTNILSSDVLPQTKLSANSLFVQPSPYYHGFGLKYFLYLSSVSALVNAATCLWLGNCALFWDIGCSRPSSPEEKTYSSQFQSLLQLSEKLLSNSYTSKLQGQVSVPCGLFFVLALKLAILSSAYVGFVPYVYCEWIDLLLQNISDGPETLPHLIDVMASLACVFPAQLQFNLMRLRFIAIYAPRSDEDSIVYAKLASQKLAHLFNYSSKDAAITSIYQLVNLLSPLDTADSFFSLSREHMNMEGFAHPSHKLPTNTLPIYMNIIDSGREIALLMNDEKIHGLAISLLIQKFSRNFDPRISAKIICALADISIKANERNFFILIQFYSIQHKMLTKQMDEKLALAIFQSRRLIANGTEPHSYKRLDLLKSLLEEIIQVGIVRDTPSDQLSGYYTAFAYAIKALSYCIDQISWENLPKDENYPALFRDMWFTIVLNRFRFSIDLSETLSPELEQIARNSPLLVFEDFGNNFESNLELNTVLRSHIEHSVLSRIKSELTSIANVDLKSLNVSEICFLSAVLLLEGLRCKTSRISALVEYLSDPTLGSSHLPQFIRAIALHNLSIFVDSLFRVKRLHQSNVKEIQKLLCLCCHRIDSVRRLALECTTFVLHNLPHLLGTADILYSILELLTLLWKARNEECHNQYIPKLQYCSPKLKLTIVLSDIYDVRERVLSEFKSNATDWITVSSKSIPRPLKNLLQSYLADFEDVDDLELVELGRSLAVEVGIKTPSFDRENCVLSSFGNWIPDFSSEFMADYTIRQRYAHENITLNMEGDMSADKVDLVLLQKSKLFEQNLSLLNDLENDTQRNLISPQKLRNDIRKAAAHAVHESTYLFSILARKIIRIPFIEFSQKSMKLGITLWNWMMNEVPFFSPYIVLNIIRNWKNEILKEKRGFFSTARAKSPLALPMTYSPTERSSFISYKSKVKAQMIPHLLLLELMSGIFEGLWYSDRQSAFIIIQFLVFVLKKIRALEFSRNALARELHFKFISFGFKIAENLLNTSLGSRYYNLCLDAALCWFTETPAWTYGADKLSVAAEISIMRSLCAKLENFLSRYPLKDSTIKKQNLLIILLKNEMYRLYTWITPVTYGRNLIMIDPIPESFCSSSAITSEMLRLAWRISPAIVLYIPKRFIDDSLIDMVASFILADPASCLHYEISMDYLFEKFPDGNFPLDRKYLLYWDPVYPVNGPVLFKPKIRWNPQLLQYTVRSMESYPVSVMFFYVPQIVQSLRYDKIGYAESFILEASGVSQLFAHQILWNMKANIYKDESGTVPDSIKPILDRVMNKMIASLSGDDKSFYEREFFFFNEVTSISGKLKPFIRKSKPEKKAKIDEEMRQIKLDVGVYLPSNPDGVVIGIDRKSGKPLQSHAKAPFMATFKIQKEKVINPDPEEEAVNGDEVENNHQKQTYEVWQSAIFKVGDDCRQDVLTLQLIAIFKNIFNSVGLDVYLFPYRVTATNPGCGVIDVLPNCISRDMLGREAVNGLYDYFITKFGGEDSIAFQKARSNFIQSMAAYSVITYLLQFKDRHNGNIMIDDQGHILHIDFGFIFDIAPGGITFESAPFKLTQEMIAVMGGNNKTQPFQWFQELCVKAFLASRPYAKSICQAVEIMLDSSLPCFKGQLSITHTLERFALDMNERQAANHMLHLIDQSYNNKRTLMYDQFQKATNGIPY